MGELGSTESDPSKRHCYCLHLQQSQPLIPQVGDFGKTNRETGEFEKEGNVYTHPDCAELAADAPPVTAAQETSLTVASRTVKRRELTLGPDL